MTQSSLDVLLTGPTGTATTTIEITTPSLEELAIEPMEKDLEDDSDYVIGSHLTPVPETTEMPTTTTTEEPAKKRLDKEPGGLLEDDEQARNVTEMTETFMTDVMGIMPEFGGEEKSCNANVCRNGGTCLSTLTGPKCHCPLQYSGRQCEEEVTVDVPGFVGTRPFLHFPTKIELPFSHANIFQFSPAFYFLSVFPANDYMFKTRFLRIQYFLTNYLFHLTFYSRIFQGSDHFRFDFDSRIISISYNYLTSFWPFLWSLLGLDLLQLQSCSYPLSILIIFSKMSAIFVNFKSIF